MKLFRSTLQRVAAFALKLKRTFKPKIENFEIFQYGNDDDIQTKPHFSFIMNLTNFKAVHFRNWE